MDTKERIKNRSNKSVDTIRVSARRFSFPPDTFNLNQTIEL
ncbi:hypothetical protein VDG1235_4036 [Verrucomicrobiia bacterium DG1235]|nr:hypothetical protein VDG1235_4036 [Verrucomicrobiae bacterium DG1235]